MVKTSKGYKIDNMGVLCLYEDEHISMTKDKAKLRKITRVK